MPLISPSSSLTNQFVFEEVDYNLTWAMYDEEEDGEFHLERDEVYEMTSYVENETGRIEQYGNMLNSESNKKTTEEANIRCFIIRRLERAS